MLINPLGITDADTSNDYASEVDGRKNKVYARWHDVVLMIKMFEVFGIMIILAQEYNDVFQNDDSNMIFFVCQASKDVHLIENNGKHKDELVEKSFVTLLLEIKVCEQWDNMSKYLASQWKLQCKGISNNRSSR